MSEIEKMYENAGVEPEIIFIEGDISKKEIIFTAEKQLELIKLIANRKGYPDYEYFGNLFDDYIQLRELDEALAQLVNYLWQDLTEEEKKQIKEILE